MTTFFARRVARLLLAPLLAVAAAVLVKGYSGAGDGFSAGAIAGLALVLQGVAGDRHELERMPIVRAAALVAQAGLALVLAVAFVPVLLGEPLLEHWPGPDAEPIRLGTLEVGTPLLFDAGAFLLVLGTVAGMLRAVAHPPEEDDER